MENQVKTFKPDSSVKSVIPVTFEIQSNDDIIQTLNHLLNLYITGQIDDKTLKAISYSFQLFQTSLRARDVDAKVQKLIKQVEELSKGDR